MTNPNRLKDLLSHIDAETTLAGYQRTSQTDALDRILSLLQKAEHRALEKERRNKQLLTHCKLGLFAAFIGISIWYVLPHRCSHAGCANWAVAGETFLSPDGRRTWTQKLPRRYCEAHRPEPIVSEMPWLIYREDLGEVVKSPANDNASGREPAEPNEN